MGQRAFMMQSDHYWSPVLKRMPKTKKYLSDETMEMHLKRLKELGQWGTHVELKAAAGILQLPIYIYTPTLKADACME